MAKVKSLILLMLLCVLLCNGQMKMGPKGKKHISEMKERKKALEELTISEEKNKNTPNQKISKRGEDDALWEARTKAYMEILVRFTLVASAALGVFPVGHFVGMLFAVITASTKAQKGSLWDQLQNQVDAQIEKKLAGYHYSNVLSHFHELDAVVELLDNTSDVEYKSYVSKVMGKKNFMLPQEYEDIGYSDKLATMLPTWAIYALPGMLELVKRGKIEKCYVAKKLAILREDTVAAGRSLLLKRYKALVPTSATGYSSIKFRDPFTDTQFESKVRSDNICEACNAVKDQTLASLKEKLVDVVNEFFTSEFCFDCACPEEISMSEISFDYKYTCFGIGASSQNSGKCSLPCAKWDGSSSYWCLQALNGWNWDRNAGWRPYRKSWDYCEPTSVDVCVV